jgi:hypothetical protein
VRTGLLAVLVGGLFLVGCDNSLQPFKEGSGQFSVYGYLSLSGGSHLIRVRDLNTPPSQGARQPLEAEVTLTNLATGQTEVLSDSIIEFDGIYTHNFRTERPLQPGAKYRLTVERPNGRSTRATATMPEVEGLELTPTDSVGCLETLALRLPGLPEDPGRFVRASAAVSLRDTFRWRKLTEYQVGRTTRVQPVTMVERVVPDSLLPGCQQDYCRRLDVDSIKVAFTHFGPDWPADDVRMDPTTSTVQNGLGVLVGIHRDTLARAVGGGADPPVCL